MNTQQLDSLAAHPLLYSVGWTLVHFVWHAAFIGAVISLALAMMRQASARTRYGVACLGLAIMALAPAVTLFWLIATTDSAGWQARAKVSQHSPTTAVSDFGFEIDETTNTDRPGQIATSQNLSEQDLSFALTGANPGNAPASPFGAVDGIAGLASSNSQGWLLWLVVIWVSGVVCLALRLLAGLCRVWRWRREGVAISEDDFAEAVLSLAKRMNLRNPVSVLKSARSKVPSVIGWIRPVILVPPSMLSGLTPAELESIIAHELAHIRRYDYLVNLLQTVVETMLFYHPAVWWLSKRIRAERENCCDDIAIEVCGNRVVLARALAHMEEIRCRHERFALAASDGSLIARIRRIVGAEPVNTGPWWPAGAIVLGSLGIMLGGLWVTAASAKFEFQQPGQIQVESSGHLETPERLDREGVKVLASHRYPESFRQSTGWVEVNGSHVPIDVGVEHGGVTVYKTLMYDIVAVDSKTGKVIWNIDWGKATPMWNTVSIVELDRSGKKELAIELYTVNGNTRESVYKYVSFETGEEVAPPAQSFDNESHTSSGIQNEKKELNFQIDDRDRVYDENKMSHPLPPNPGQELPVDYVATGMVVDSDGNAVPRAELYTHYYQDSTWTAISSMCDAEGRFELRLPDQPSIHSMFHTWVRAESHGIQVVNMSFVMGKAGRTENLEIKLPKNNRSRYRVFLPDGSPAKGAVVSMAMMHLPQGCFYSDQPNGLIGLIPKELKLKTAGTANDLGEVVLEGFASWSAYQIEIELPGFGLQSFPAKYQDLTLAPTGKVRLEVNREGFPGFSGVMAYLETTTGREDFNAKGCAEIRIDESGVAEIPEMAAGTLRLELWDWNESSGSHPWVEPRQKLDQGGELVISIEPRETVAVHGVVLTADTRQPVAGTRIHLRNDESRYSPETVYTNEQGRFETRAIRGAANLQVTGLADELSQLIWNEYSYPKTKSIEVGEPEEQGGTIEILLPRKQNEEQDDEQNEEATGWGDLAHVSGLRSRLTLQSENPVVGQPVIFKLEVRNFGDVPTTVDPQRYAPFRVLRAMDSNGQSARFIGMKPQTDGQEQILKPGESLTLWENVDANDLFLLEQGTYKFLAEGGEWALQAYWRDSNILEVEIGAGEQTPSNRLLKNLGNGLPEHWELTSAMGKQWGWDAMYLTHQPTGLKSDATSIQIWFTDEKLADDFELGKGEQKQIVTQFGQCELGFMNVAAYSRTAEIWPDYLEHIRKGASDALNFVESTDRKNK